MQGTYKWNLSFYKQILRTKQQQTESNYEMNVGGDDVAEITQLVSGHLIKEYVTVICLPVCDNIKQSLFWLREKICLTVTSTKP